MHTARCARLHWREMVWYGWTLASAAVLAASVLAYLVGFDGLVALF